MSSFHPWWKDPKVQTEYNRVRAIWLFAFQEWERNINETRFGWTGKLGEDYINGSATREVFIERFPLGAFDLNGWIEKCLN